MYQSMLLAFSSILNSLAVSLNFWCSTPWNRIKVFCKFILLVQFIFSWWSVGAQADLALSQSSPSVKFLSPFDGCNWERMVFYAFLDAHSFCVVDLTVNFASQIVSTWSQSPKFGRKPYPSTAQDTNSRPPRRPSINTESSKRLLMKNNRIACSVTALPKNRHENASPNIQHSVGKESISYRHDRGGSIAGGCSHWPFLNWFSNDIIEIEKYCYNGR